MALSHSQRQCTGRSQLSPSETSGWEYSDRSLKKIARMEEESRKGMNGDRPCNPPVKNFSIGYHQTLTLSLQNFYLNLPKKLIAQALQRMILLS